MVERDKNYRSRGIMIIGNWEGRKYVEELWGRGLKGLGLGIGMIL